VVVLALGGAPIAPKEFTFSLGRDESSWNADITEGTINPAIFQSLRREEVLRRVDARELDLAVDVLSIPQTGLAPL
jgi:hypothetical protein